MYSMSNTAKDDNGIYRSIGQRIREQRDRRSMTQADLAQAISLTRTSITNIEKGRQKLMIHTLFEVARVLGVSPQTLLPDPEQLEVDAAERVPRDISEKDRELIRSAIIQRKGGR